MFIGVTTIELAGIYGKVHSIKTEQLTGNYRKQGGWVCSIPKFSILNKVHQHEFSPKVNIRFDIWVTEI